jgi:hypothetical protein
MQPILEGRTMGRPSRLPWSLVSWLGRHLVASVIFWVIALASVQLGERVLGGWPATEAGQLLACVLGVVIARHMRAPVMSYCLGAMAAFSASELTIHLYYGIRAAPGAATHFAVMGAGILGVAVGALLMMGGRPAQRVGGLAADGGLSRAPDATNVDGPEIATCERRSNLALQPAGARS